MKTLELTELFNRYLQNTCSEAEVELLMVYFHSPDEGVLNKLVAEELDRNDLNSASHEQNVQISIDKVYQNLKNNISDQIKNQHKKIRRLWFRIAATAAILFIVSGGLFYYISHRITPNLFQDSGLAVNDIKPGGNKAYLTLANGKKLSLTDAASGALAKEAGVEISKTADGRVIYTTPASNSEQASTLSNTIETPRGGQYQVRLPDGSKVWLNAASKLVYPVSFAAQKERKVILIGEAYFEITKDKEHPFHVKTALQDIEVLGTHFNVNGYTDEGSTKTTLLEGSVRVLPAMGGVGAIVLKPGQQSSLTAGKMNITEIDTDEAIAWKEGVFNFNNEDISSIMRKLARWYNIEVVYEGKITNVRFGAEISRSRSLAQVLKVLEKTEGIQFKIEGRRVTVMQ